MPVQILGALIVLFLLTPNASAQKGGSAELIVRGGEIVTVNELQPRAEAVAVRGGTIVAVGCSDEVMKLKGPNTQVIDLAGKTLVPGFIDAHGHLSSTGVQALAANLLAAPDGEVKDIASLQDKLCDWHKGKTSQQLGWIIGFGYDDAQLKEQRHPTRDDLDAVSKDVPVLAVHQSGHLAGANSKALELAKISAATKNPPGGVIRRKMSLGGSPQGKTAWLTQPYFKPPPGQTADYVGYPAFEDEAQVDAKTTADARGSDISCAASARCFSAMANVGAHMVGEAPHRD